MSPYKKKNRDNNKVLIVVLAALLVISLAISLFLLNRLVASKKTITAQKQILVNIQEPDDHTSEIEGKWYGLCEKNRVHSIDDFARIVHSDPLLALHFADFDWQNARMGQLENSVWSHIAYRKNEKITTTRKLIMLPKGDGYITDGKRWVRTYCCNDYVVAPRPISERVDEAEPFIDRVASAAPVAPATRTAQKSTPPLPPGSPPPEFPPPIPEPGSMLLVATGIFGLGFTGWYRRNRR